MTNDIVAWLRVVSDDYGMGRCEEAADEIERLREVLYEWDALIEHQYTGSREAMSDMTYAAQATAALLYGEAPWPQKTRVEKQADEIERLRVALREIAELPGEINPSNYDHDDACELNRQFCYASEIARAALAGEKTND